MAKKKPDDTKREGQGDIEEDNEESSRDKDRETKEEVKRAGADPNPWDPGPGRANT